jgi:zinc protease
MQTSFPGLQPHSAGKAKTALPGSDDVLRRTLPNGVTVLARENWSAPSVSLRGYLYAGNLDEPEDLRGVASFTANMLTRGTERRTFAEISETVETASASVSFWSEAHVTRFAAKSLAEDLDLILDVLADEMRHSIFPAEYVDRVRGMRLSSIDERENDTGAMAGLAYLDLMYGGHPLGRDALGDRQSNARITRDALAQFHSAYFAPQGMVIVIVGAVAAEDAVARVERSFGDWSQTRPARPAIPPLPVIDSPRSKRVLVRDKSQADILLGWRAMRRTDPDFESGRLANTILGVFGMMGRLGESVRERQGMAYYAYSSLAGGRETGSWVASAGVAPGNVERAAASMLEEVERLRQEPVSEEEIEDSKRFMIGSLPLQLEANEGVAGLLLDIEWFGLGLDYLERYTTSIQRLTPAEVQAVAQRYLRPDGYVQAVAGP